jgi:hypothetical protein
LIEERNSAYARKTISITEAEQQLLNLFRRVPESQQDMVLQMISVALNNVK